MTWILLVVFTALNRNAITSQQIVFESKQACKKAEEVINHMDNSVIYTTTQCVKVK